MAKRYTLGEQAKKDFDRLRNAPIKISGGRQRKGTDAEGTLWIKITGFALVSPGDPHRWVYSGVIQLPNQNAGNEGTFYDPEPLVAVENIYNTCESNNTNPAMLGNSVNAFALPAGFAVQPIQGNPVLPAQRLANTNAVEFFLVTYQNAVDGSCQ